MAVSLLNPIGQHQQTHIKPSQGKRAAKREQKAIKASVSIVKPPVPPLPVISSSVDVGFNSITRKLESWSSSHGNQRTETSTPIYSMIFVARGNQASAFNCHFPQMVGVASNTLSPENKIRLVGFSKPCSDRLSGALGLPRVSSVAIIQDAPGAEALQELVRKTVGPVDMKWMDDSKNERFLPTKIKAVETTVGSKRVKVEI